MSRPMGEYEERGSPGSPNDLHGPASGLHVAIIMDGNGRCAKERGLPRALGHRAGVAALRRTGAAESVERRWPGVDDAVAAAYPQLR